MQDNYVFKHFTIDFVKDDFKYKETHLFTPKCDMQDEL